MFFDVVPAGTTMFVLGARPGRAERAAAALAGRHPSLEIVGTHHGYFDARSERAVLEEVARRRPQLVLVGMGNPQQVELIARHLDESSFSGTMWLAVGGFLDYYAGWSGRRPGSSDPTSSGSIWFASTAQAPALPSRHPDVRRPLPRRPAAWAPRAPRRSGPVVKERASAGVKATLRHLFAAVGRLDVRRRRDESAPRVLCYHGVCDPPPNEWSVTPAQLRRHVEVLSHSYVPASLSDVVGWVREERELPDRSVALTFDDGYVDVLREAAPLLADAHIPATVFVAPGLLSGEPADETYRPSRPIMSWAEVEELVAAGWEVGSHSMTHPRLAELPGHRARQELQRSRDELEQRLGRRIDTLAYPYGTAHTVSRRDELLAAEVGYRAAFMDMTGRLRRHMEPTSLPRSKVLGSDSMFVVRATLEGRLDTWRFVEERD